MQNIAVKYLKDNNGNIFSPVVSNKSVYDSNGNSIETMLLSTGVGTEIVRDISTGSATLSVPQICSFMWNTIYSKISIRLCR